MSENLVKLLQRLDELVGEQPQPPKACPLCGSKQRQGRVLVSNDPDESRTEPCPVCRMAEGMDTLVKDLQVALEKARRVPVKLSLPPTPAQLPCPSCTGWHPFYVRVDTGQCITCGGLRRVPNPVCDPDDDAKPLSKLAVNAIIQGLQGLPNLRYDTREPAMLDGIWHVDVTNGVRGVSVEIDGKRIGITRLPGEYGADADKYAKTVDEAIATIVEMLKEP
jgi:hypothetical protein